MLLLWISLAFGLSIASPALSQALSNDLGALDGTTGVIMSGVLDSENFGRSISNAGDINGDGIDDIIIGRGITEFGFKGRAFIMFGGSAVLSANHDTSALTGTNGFQIRFSDAIDEQETVGFSVTGIGDFNGDGIDDLAVGAPFANVGGGFENGKVYVILGNDGSTDGGFPDTLTLDTLPPTKGFIIEGEANFDHAGWSVALGSDGNFDGTRDLLIGAPGADPGGVSNAGKAYVVYATSSVPFLPLDLGTLDPATTGFAYAGSQVNGAIGFSVDGAGDVDGDGTVDVLLGGTGLANPNNLPLSSPGGAFVIYNFSAVFDPIIDLGTMSFAQRSGVFGNIDFAEMGTSVSSLGDVNGDGFDDFVVGGPGGGANGTGQALIVYGKNGGLTNEFMDETNADGINLTKVDDVSTPGGSLGTSVTGVGDFNGSGFNDILIGAPGTSVGPNSSAGISYLALGRSSGFGPSIDLQETLGLTFRIFTGANAFDFSGSAGGGGGDFNGDGRTDLLIGANGGNGNTGEAYVLFGDPAVPVFTANDDAFTTNEDSSFESSVRTNDILATTATVTAVNGSVSEVGMTITLASGALLVVPSSGLLSYSPNGQFESLGPNDTFIEPTITYDLFDGTTTDTANVVITVTGVNDPATGSVLIIGTTTVGQTLSASPLDILDPEGTGTGVFTYQWKADGIDISGATSVNYVLVAGDVGKTISVQAQFVDGGGTTETLNSLGRGPVAAGGGGNSLPTGQPTITGNETQGQILSGDVSGIADADGIPVDVSGFPNIQLQWNRDGVPITNANGPNYTLTQADVGTAITLTGSFTDLGGTAESVTSLPTASIANINDAPTGVPVVTGTPIQNQTLTADASAIADIDGLGIFSFQWIQDTTPITGATSNTYSPVQGDVGFPISVAVSYTDGFGTAETVVSAKTANVANVNDAPVGVPTIAGSAIRGQTLTASTGAITDADGLGIFSFQWVRDVSPIAGATSASYDLVLADVGFPISVEVSYTDGFGTAETVTSAPTANVINVNSPPVGQPTIAGTATQGQTLTADAGAITDADGITGATFVFQWLRSGTPVTGATSATYVLVQADVGERMSVEARYTDDQGTNELVTSLLTAVIANVNDAATGVPTIAGTLTQGQTLTAKTDAIADPDGLGTFSFQWKRDGVDVATQADKGISSAAGVVAGSPEQYLLTQADVGGQMSVAVSFVDGFGTAETVISAPTAAVVNINDAPVAQDDGFMVLNTGTLTVGNVLADNGNGPDSDADGDALSVSAVNGASGNVGGQFTLPSGALLALAANGAIQYDPNGQFPPNGSPSSTDSFTYTADDGNGGNDTASVTITVDRTGGNSFASGSAELTGVFEEGAVLGVETQGIDDVNGLGVFSFQWRRNGNDIVGETAQLYTLAAADIGQEVQIAVLFTDGAGFPEEVVSAPSALIAPHRPQAGTFPAAFDVSTLDGNTGFRINGLTPFDRAGSGAGFSGDINNDGLDDILLGAIASQIEGTGSGQAYLVCGRSEGFDPVLELAALNGVNGFAINPATAGENVGSDMEVIGDINGDGMDDYMIGARASSPAGRTEAGKTYVVFGPATRAGGAMSLSEVNGTNGFVINGAGAGDHSGFAVAGIGDFNGDGIPDFAIGAPDSGTGKLFVIFGQAGGPGATLDLGSLNGINGFVLTGVSGSDRLGHAVTGGGDLNGDGRDDLVIGAPGAGGGNGSVHILFGGSTFAASQTSAALDGINGFSIPGDEPGGFGTSVAMVGDLNNDGLDDFALGAPNFQGAGGTIIVFGNVSPPAGPVLLPDDLFGDGATGILGENAGDRMGSSMAAAGDLNGDGIDDMIIGAEAASPGGRTGAGQSYVIFGSAGGFAPILDLNQLNTFTGMRIAGVSAGDALGTALAQAGDMDGDGVDDILITSPGFSPNNRMQAGAAHVIFGRSNNALPDLANDNFVVSEDGLFAPGFVFNDNGSGTDSDPDGDQLHVMGVNGQFNVIGLTMALPSGALLTMHESGVFTWDPNGQFDGLGEGVTTEDRFTYQVSDGIGPEVSAEVVLTVMGANDTPTGTPALSGFALQGQTLTVSTANISDADGMGTLSFQWRRDGVSVSGQTGTSYLLTVADLGSQIDVLVSYTDSGNITETLASPASAPISNGNLAPQAMDDVLSADADHSFTGNVLANNGGGLDTDPDGDPLQITELLGFAGQLGDQVTLASGALLTLHANGDFIWDPNGQFDTLAAGQTANDSFAYQISDGKGGSDRGDVSFSIQPLQGTILVAAVLPGARSTSLMAAETPIGGTASAGGNGVPITAFATIINGGTARASSCSISVPAKSPVQLQWQETDASNAPIGVANTSFDLEAGQARSFLLTLNPTRTSIGETVAPAFACANGQVDPLPGINTMFLSITQMPGPDLISASATPSGDGIVRIATHGGSSFLTASAINIGRGNVDASADARVTVSANTGNAVLPLTVGVCETNALSECLAAPTDSFEMVVGDNPGFVAVFVTDTGTNGIPLDAVNARINLIFTSPEGILLSATSVAVTAPPPADAPQIAASSASGVWAVTKIVQSDSGRSVEPATMAVLGDGTAIISSASGTTRLALSSEKPGQIGGQILSSANGFGAGGAVAGRFADQRSIALAASDGGSSTMTLWGVADARAQTEIQAINTAGFSINLAGDMIGQMDGCAITGRLTLDAKSGLRTGPATTSNCKTADAWSSLLLPLAGGLADEQGGLMLILFNDAGIRQVRIR
jgi:VCBS repeat-containing protein